VLAKARETIWCSVRSRGDRNTVVPDGAL